MSASLPVSMDASAAHIICASCELPPGAFPKLESAKSSSLRRSSGIDLMVMVALASTSRLKAALQS